MLYIEQDTQGRKEISQITRNKGDYKRFLKAPKANIIENEGRRIAEEAEKDPFITLRKKESNSHKGNHNVGMGAAFQRNTKLQGNRGSV